MDKIIMILATNNQNTGYELLTNQIVAQATSFKLLSYAERRLEEFSSPSHSERLKKFRPDYIFLHYLTKLRPNRQPMVVAIMGNAEAIMHLSGFLQEVQINQFVNLQFFEKRLN
jgi:hypothetical protein